MARPGKLLTLLAVLAFAGLLLYSTLSSQRVECTVTVAFEADASREAQTTACGPLVQGMNESIACGRIPPISRQCRNL
jgi:hypothetical protein